MKFVIVPREPTNGMVEWVKYNINRRHPKDVVDSHLVKQVYSDAVHSRPIKELVDNEELLDTIKTGLLSVAPNDRPVDQNYVELQAKAVLAAMLGYSNAYVIENEESRSEISQASLKP